jgi:hypothetical protein
LWFRTKSDENILGRAGRPLGGAPFFKAQVHQHHTSPQINIFFLNNVALINAKIQQIFSIS